MNKILVPYDFSKPAIAAFQFALDIAAMTKGTIHLLHVVELPVLHDTMMMPVLNFEQELLDSLKENAEKTFIKAIEKFNKEGLLVETAVEFGTVVGKITDYIAAEKIDLVIMGSHGASGWREFFVGSNAERLVRNSPVPVLVLKNYFKGPIKNIVFPNSLEDVPQEGMIMKIKALQHLFKAHLHIVWINTPLNFASDPTTFKRIEAYAKRYKLSDYTINIFNHTDEEEGIMEFTKVIEGDLIAMATHGRKGISHLLNGSVAEDVANHTQKLVWTYSLKNEPAELIS